MLRRTKIIIACYCIAGLVLLALAIGIVFQLTDWLRHPEQFEKFGHHHHHEEEVQPPESSPAETYTRDGKTYLKAPFLKKDFDVTESRVDLRQVLYVNLNVETFPELKELRFVSPEETKLPGQDAVLGVSIAGEHKAYPIRMLNYHVVLNDICGEKQIAVVWDPLTMTPKVFDRRLERSDGSRLLLTLGNLGLIHRGGLLLYDKETESIWWPPEGKCLAGNLGGASLGEHRFLLVSWNVWKERRPTTSVLSTDTPFRHLYAGNFYDTYYRMPELPLPVEGWEGGKSPLRWSEPVIALEAEGKAKAYPLSVLSSIRGSVEDTFAGMKVIIQGAESGLPYLTDEQGRDIRYSFGAWFLWSVRYPDIEVYRGNSGERSEPQGHNK